MFVQLVQKALSGEYCWDGRTLSHGELAGIAIGAVVALGILIAIPLLGLAYYKKRKIKHQIEVCLTYLLRSPFYLADFLSIVSNSAEKYRIKLSSKTAFINS